MAVRTRASLIVVHRKTWRAFSCNDEYEVLEPLILDLPDSFSYKSMRVFWKPMLPNTPLWAAGRRDLEFDSYWV